MKAILILTLFFWSVVDVNEPPQEVMLLAFDARALDMYPDVFQRIGMSNISTRPDGLIGRNAKWDSFYASRFQMGAGYSLRLALLYGDPHYIEQAFRSLQAGIEPIEEDGRVPANVPDELKPSPDAQPSLGDQASGAAFFLGDACLGIYALAQADTHAVISQVERDRAIEKLHRAIDWLANHADILFQIDSTAPNRLLFNARAFQSCSLIHDNPEKLQLLAGDFVDAALNLFHPDGYFIEGDGWDTNYQAVAIDIGNEVLLSGYTDKNDALRITLDIATAWLVGRIDAEGRIDSTGNTRTCWGQEDFLGEFKSLSITSVVRSIIYRSLHTDNDDWQAAAERVIEWVQRTNQEVDPCFAAT